MYDFDNYPQKLSILARITLFYVLSSAFDLQQFSLILKFRNPTLQKIKPITFILLQPESQNLMRFLQYLICDNFGYILNIHEYNMAPEATLNFYIVKNFYFIAAKIFLKNVLARPDQVFII